MGTHATTSSLSLTFAGHATVLLEMDGVRLLTDPLLRKRIGVLIRRSPVPPPAVRRDLDAVLISHAHLDHLDVPSLRLIDRRTPVVVPRGLGSLLRRLGFVPLEMDVGDEVEIGPAIAGGKAGPARVRVKAVPADHAGLAIHLPRIHLPWATSSPAGSAPTSPATPACTTACKTWRRSTSPCSLSEAGGRGCPGPPQPVAGGQGARVAAPCGLLPVHWGTIYPPWLPPEFNAKWAEWPHVFARYAAQLTPEVDVRILQPGESTVFAPARRGGRRHGSERD